MVIPSEWENATTRDDGNIYDETAKCSEQYIYINCKEHPGDKGNPEVSDFCPPQGLGLIQTAFDGNIDQ